MSEYEKSCKDEMNEIEEAMQAAEDHGIECKFEDDYIKPIS